MAQYIRYLGNIVGESGLGLMLQDADYVAGVILLLQEYLAKMCLLASRLLINQVHLIWIRRWTLQLQSINQSALALQPHYLLSCDRHYVNQLPTSSCLYFHLFCYTATIAYVSLLLLCPLHFNYISLTVLPAVPLLFFLCNIYIKYTCALFGLERNENVNT